MRSDGGSQSLLHYTISWEGLTGKIKFLLIFLIKRIKVQKQRRWQDRANSSPAEIMAKTERKSMFLKPQKSDLKTIQERATQANFGYLQSICRTFEAEPLDPTFLVKTDHILNSSSSILGNSYYKIEKLNGCR
jgi:hypothetical protein